MVIWQSVYICDGVVTLDAERGLADAAQLFKVLGHESRLWLLRLVGQEPRTVSALTLATGMTQPLVSQHLRTLRQTGLVTAARKGKEVTYRLADEHVSHLVADALAHVREPGRPSRDGGASRKGRTP
jgi:DNA-binding transcriptional ArsR family regulator